MLGFPPLDFDDHHRRVLPARARSAVGAVAARDVREVPPLAFRVPDGRAWRFVPGGETIRIEPGDDAPTVVELAATAWSDFVHELHTVAGLLYGGHARFLRGAAADLERWEPALRALFSGRPIFDPERLALCDPAGAALDLDRRFTLDDPDAELRHFLHEAGFVHVRGVFTRDEIDGLAALIERQRAGARPGDGRSWWARTAEGADVVCRLIYLGRDVPEIAALNGDRRVRRLGALAAEPLRPLLDRCDGHSAVLKHPGVVEGLSDLPWHRDCGLGGHPVTCPALNIGIQLDAASAATGRLSFLVGSWRASCHRRDLERKGLPVVAVDTEPGDCTVHLGDVLHTAPPPTGPGPGRRVLYVAFMPERAFDFIPPGRGYNDVIRARVGGRPQED